MIDHHCTVYARISIILADPGVHIVYSAGAETHAAHSQPNIRDSHSSNDYAGGKGTCASLHAGFDLPMSKGRASAQLAKQKTGRSPAKSVAGARGAGLRLGPPPGILIGGGSGGSPAQAQQFQASAAGLQCRGVAKSTISVVVQKGKSCPSLVAGPASSKWPVLQGGMTSECTRASCTCLR